MWMHTTHFPSAKNIALKWEWLEGQQMLHSKCYIPKGSKHETNLSPFWHSYKMEFLKNVALCCLTCVFIRTFQMKMENL